MANGRVIWHELMTSDVEGAKRFYGELFGWSIKEFPAGGKPYYVASAGAKGTGGLMAGPSGEPSRWVTYVDQRDLDACLARAKAAGGTVLVGPMDVPDVGRIAYIQDPKGGVTAAMSPKPPGGVEPPQTQPGRGEFCWDSLATPNPAADVAFYKQVYGWSEHSFGQGKTLGTGEGMMNQLASVDPASGAGKATWSSYVMIDNLAATRERAKKLGGSIVLESMAVPEMGKFAVLKDPQGATICVFEPDKP